uniref:Uncharacterized protein n=1 Tax=Anguilla anguilla TaxID=7936 RepID=A0A0E9W357_ANGAN
MEGSGSVVWEEGNC